MHTHLQRSDITTINTWKRKFKAGKSTRGITTASARRVRGKKRNNKCQNMCFHWIWPQAAVCLLFTRNPYTFQNNCIVFFFFPPPFLDAILNMVNNIAANVLGGKPDQEGGTETGGTLPSSTWCILFFFLRHLSCQHMSTFLICCLNPILSFWYLKSNVQQCYRGLWLQSACGMHWCKQVLPFFLFNPSTAEICEFLICSS